MKELRFHGRGGQGTVEACQLLAKSLIKDGLYAQLIPSFGVERKGSPVFGFFRIDDKEIRPKTQVYDPDLIVILDETLIELVDVFSSNKAECSVLINTSKPGSAFNLPDNVTKVTTIDANTIAFDLIGSVIPNTVMLGALARFEDSINAETLAEFVFQRFGALNVKAFQAGLERTAFWVRR